jgi:excisionase family DNA binding protein
VLLTPREVASTLRVDLSTVYRWIDRGTIGAVQFGGARHTVRIPAAELVRLSASPRPAASEPTSTIAGLSPRGLEGKPAPTPVRGTSSRPWPALSCTWAAHRPYLKFRKRPVLAGPSRIHAQRKWGSTRRRTRLAHPPPRRQPDERSSLLRVAHLVAFLTAQHHAMVVPGRAEPLTWIRRQRTGWSGPLWRAGFRSRGQWDEALRGRTGLRGVMGHPAECLLRRRCVSGPVSLRLRRGEGGHVSQARRSICSAPGCTDVLDGWR